MAAAHGGGAGALQTAAANRGTGVWNHQRGDGIPAVHAAGTGEGEPGMDAGVFGLQLQATASAGGSRVKVENRLWPGESGVKAEREGSRIGLEAPATQRANIVHNPEFQ